MSFDVLERVSVMVSTGYQWIFSHLARGLS
jgi:hypothetical protein